LALVLLAPALVAVALELALRLAGYGYPTRFFIDDPGRGTCHDNEKFVWQFYSPRTLLSPQPFDIARQKPAGTIRIVILGESAAAGTPEPSFGFGRILERMLRRQYPRTKFEVINAAIRGINSHIILPIARDCAELDPDLFIAYMGNNEIVGLYAPGPHSGYLTPYRRVLQVVQWIQSTRLGEWMSAAVGRRGDASAAEEQDMAFFRARRLAADDPRREAIYRNFSANLEDICRIGARGRVPVVLTTVAVNLRDSPPFGSLHRMDLTEADKGRWDSAYDEGGVAEHRGRFEEAIQHYQAAARLDDHFAELHYRLGRCYLASGHYADARHHYTLAKDWDALQFRADRWINQIVRRVASTAGIPGISLVDAEEAFAKSPLSDHGIPGETLFYEHAHLRFDGDYLLARTLYPSVIAALRPKLGQAATAASPSRDECAAALAFTRFDEARLAASMVEVPTQPPFLDQVDHDERLLRARQTLTQRFGDLNQQDVEKSIQTYRGALREAPEDWQLYYNFASFYFNLHDFAAAAEQFKVARKIMSRYRSITLGLSRALAEAGNFAEAEDYLHELLNQDPDFRPAKDGLATVRAMRARRPTQ
jgi:tetratricopeptide (TPR) repeat protein